MSHISKLKKKKLKKHMYGSQLQKLKASNKICKFSDPNQPKTLLSPIKKITLSLRWGGRPTDMESFPFPPHRPGRSPKKKPPASLCPEYQTKGPGLHFIGSISTLTVWNGPSGWKRGCLESRGAGRNVLTASRGRALYRQPFNNTQEIHTSLSFRKPDGHTRPRL